MASRLHPTALAITTNNNPRCIHILRSSSSEKSRFNTDNIWMKYYFVITGCVNMNQTLEYGVIREFVYVFEIQVLKGIAQN